MKLLLNGTQYAMTGHVRARVDGRLVYVANGVERCAWVGGPDGPNGPADVATWRQNIIREDLIDYAQSIAEPYFVLNVEHYAIDSLGRIIDILETIRFARPDLMIGLWSVLPVSDFTTVANFSAYQDFRAGRPHDARGAGWWAQPVNGPAITQRFLEWKERDRLIARKLRPHLDFTCPSIYPVYEPTRDQLWTAAREPELMIAECRQLCPSLPCFPCWTPHIYASNKRASPALMQTVLEAAIRKADGVMIWTDGFISESEAVSVMSGARSIVDEMPAREV